MKRNYIVTDTGRTAHDPFIKSLFGLTSADKWPKEGMPRRRVQGIEIWVRPFVPGSRKHRAVAHCPVCDEVFTIGTLRQHSVVHEPRTLLVEWDGYSEKHVPELGHKLARHMRRRGYVVTCTSLEDGGL